MNAELVWSLLIKGSAILIVAGLVTLAMRRSSASRRHLVWLAALTAILLVPLAQIRLPNWSVEVDRAPLVTPLLAPQALQPIVQAPGKHALFTVSPVFTPHGPAPKTPPFDYGAVIQAVWILGCAILLSWTAFGLLMVGLLVRRGSRSDLAEEIGREAAPGIRILVCPKLRVPAMAGIVRPAILLPAEALIWDRHRLRMVIAHEAAHIRRKDWLWQIFGQTACAVNFFNPLAWVAFKQLRKESEVACDDFVLAMGFEPDSYARALLDIARTSRFQVAGTVGMARSANVEDRLKSIIDSHRNRNWVSGRAALSALVAALAVAMPLALLKAMPRIAAMHAAFGTNKHSGPALPQIPWVRSKQVSPNIFVAQNGVAGLPNGYRVKLIGISPDGSPAIWGLDGKPLPGADLWNAGTGKFWNGNVFNRRAHGFASRMAAFNRMFYVEVESEADATPSICFDMESPSATTQQQRLNQLMAGGGEKIPEVAFSVNDPSYAPIELCVPSRAETGVVRFGVTADNWQTVADIKNPVTVQESGISRVGFGDPKYGDQCTLQLDNEPVLWYLDRHMASHVIKLTEGQPPLSSDTARRVLLFDKDGQPIDPGTHGAMMSGYPLYAISARNFSRIARVVVQTTPYIWAEFRDVPLLPDFEKEEADRAATHAATLESGITGTAAGIAPGFSKVLSDGTTVSIESVTKAIVDNQKWVMMGQPSWRADGEVLAQRPKIAWYPIPFSTKYPDPYEVLQVGFAGLGNEASTTVRFTSKFDPKTDRPVFRDRASWCISAAPDDKTGAALIGVAKGPWVTESTQDIDMLELAAVESADPDNDYKTQVRTGFEVVVGKDCYVHDMTADTKLKMACKPLTRYAIRVMARLKNGEVRELRSGMSTPAGSIYPVPQRRGEWTLGYSNILASEVRSVEIQARPYEFVEFDGIALEHK